MFKKRETFKVQQRRRLTSNDSVHDDHSEPRVIKQTKKEENESKEQLNNSHEVSERIKDTKDRHRLRQRTKGLAMDDQLIMISRKKGNDLEDDSKFDLLNKSFRQQGEKPESHSRIDQHL